MVFFLGICLVSSEVFYPYQILSAQHYSFPKSRESDRERWDFVVMSRVLERIHHCRDSMSPGMSDVIWPNPTGVWLHGRDYSTVTGGQSVCLHYMAKCMWQSKWTYYYTHLIPQLWMMIWCLWKSFPPDFNKVCDYSKFMRFSRFVP